MGRLCYRVGELHPTSTEEHTRIFAYDDCSNNDVFFVHELDSDAWIGWQYIIMMLFSHLKI
jgi:hypothetical protein